MAEERLDLVVSVRNKAATSLKSIKSSLKSIGAEIKATSKKTSALNRELGRIPSVAKIAFAAATAAAVLFAKKAIDGYRKQESALNRLFHLTQQTSGATREQTEALIEQAEALQQLGVVGDEITIFGQSQLATFALQTETIHQLTPALLDMAVAVDGVNVTQESMMNISNLLGKAMLGQVGALTRYGVTMTEAQQSIIKTGTESEKAAVMVEILTQNFGGLNEAMRKTDEGGAMALQNRLGDMTEEIGRGLSPALVNAKTAAIDFGLALYDTEDAALASFDAMRDLTEMTAISSKALVDWGLGMKSLLEFGKLAGKSVLDVTPFGDNVLTNPDKYFGGQKTNTQLMNENLAEIGDRANALDKVLSDLINRNRDSRVELEAGGDAADDTTKRITSGFGEATEAVEKTTGSLKGLLSEFESLERKVAETMESIQKQQEEAALAGLDARQRAAALYVQQEQNVLDIQKQINEEMAKEKDERDTDKIGLLSGDRLRAQQELERAGIIPATMAADVAEARRRAGLSEFQTAIEDLQLSEASRNIEHGGKTSSLEAERTEAMTKIYNFTFNGDVNDKEKLQEEIIEAVDRQSAIIEAGD